MSKKFVSLVPTKSTGTSDTLSKTFAQLLVVSGATQRSVELFLQLRGLDGGSPKSLRGVCGKLSGERVRQLIGELEGGALQALLNNRGPEASEFRALVTSSLRRIEAHAPGSDGDIREALLREFDPCDLHPAGVVRVADLMGINHGLRLTDWTERAKFEDAGCTKLATKLLASNERGAKRTTICGVVPAEMPEIFQNFINFARKFSRGAGVVAAGKLANQYGAARGIAIAPNEAAAFLRPFAVHLGRHDGDEWFAFFNSANEFVRKATARVELFGHGSFEQICQFHQRFNRSLYALEESAFPVSVLRAALELAGYRIDGDHVTLVRPMKRRSDSGISAVQLKMVKVFRGVISETPGKLTVGRDKLISEMIASGINESTARVYLARKGLFDCRNGACRLTDGLYRTEDFPSAASVALRGRPAGSATKATKAASAIGKAA